MQPVAYTLHTLGPGLPRSLTQAHLNSGRVRVMRYAKRLIRMQDGKIIDDEIQEVG